MHRSAFRTLILGILFTASLSAQQVPGTTITGHVICADTNTPARFAKVLLKSAAPDHAVEDEINSEQAYRRQTAAGSGKPMNPLTEDEKKNIAADTRFEIMETDMSNFAAVGLDGAFTFVGVKPGIYFVRAILAGYIDPFSQLSDAEFASTDPATRALIAQIPTVTVSGTDSARVDLRIERGAAASGRLLFDDGSPAAGWTISALRPRAENGEGDMQHTLAIQALSFANGVPVVQSDDLGRFRVSGLPAGDFTLRVTLITASGLQRGRGVVLTVYTGDTFSHAKARSIHLGSGEEGTGNDITIPSHKLHVISGHVYAKSDDHVINTGQVLLTAPDDPSVHFTAPILSDGSFRFDYLPGGVTYMLAVSNPSNTRIAVVRASQPPNVSTLVGTENSREETVHRYGPATLSVTLDDADLDTVHFTVPDLADASSK